MELENVVKEQAEHIKRIEALVLRLEEKLEDHISHCVCGAMNDVDFDADHMRYSSEDGNDNNSRRNSLIRSNLSEKQETVESSSITEVQSQSSEKRPPPPPSRSHTSSIASNTAPPLPVSAVQQRRAPPPPVRSSPNSQNESINQNSPPVSLRSPGPPARENSPSVTSSTKKTPPGPPPPRRKSMYAGSVSDNTAKKVPPPPPSRNQQQSFMSSDKAEDLSGDEDTSVNRGVTVNSMDGSDNNNVNNNLRKPPAIPPSNLAERRSSLGATGVSAMKANLSNLFGGGNNNIPQRPVPKVNHSARRHSTTNSGDQLALTLAMKNYAWQQDPEDSEKKHEQRGKLRDEIISTETSYLNSLSTLVTEYFDVLDSKCKSFSLEPSQNAVMFSNIRALHGFHLVFLGELEKAGVDMPTVFVKNADFLKMYTQYLNSYTDAMNMINLLRENRKFQDFLAVQRSKTGMSLMSYLIMPVQRIPRYVLLLRELLKHTPQKHPTFASLSEALAKVSDIAAHVNEQKRVVENMTRLLEIQNTITGADFTLLLPDRRLIKEGSLKKVSVSFTKSMSMSEVNIFLFNDVFLWTNTNNKLKGYFPLNNCGLDGGDDVDGMCMFNIKCDKRDLTLYAENFEQQKSWVTEIKKAIAECQETMQAQQTRKWQARTIKSATSLSKSATLGKDHVSFLKDLANQKGGVKQVQSRRSMMTPGNPPEEVKAPQMKFDMSEIAKFKFKNTETEAEEVEE